MSAAYADTSLLASLCLADANTPKALALVSAHARPLLLTSWQRFELENATQLRLFRREIDVSAAAGAGARMLEDISAGAFIEASVPFPAVLATARKLAARHSAVLGTRAFDVFHVAAALELKAARFFTFDQRQQALAKAAGLRV